MTLALRWMGNLVTDEDRDRAARVWRWAGPPVDRPRRPAAVRLRPDARRGAVVPRDRGGDARDRPRPRCPAALRPGLEHLPRTGPVVLASNHVSYPDFLWIGLARPRARSLGPVPDPPRRLEQPRSRRAMDGMRHVPVDREAPAAAYLAARRLLARGRGRRHLPGGRHLLLVRRPVADARTGGARSRDRRAARAPRAVGHPAPLVGRPSYAGPDGPGPTLAAPARRRRLRRGVDGPAGRGPGRRQPPVWVTPSPTWSRGSRATPTTCRHRGKHAPWHPAHLGGHAPDRAEALGLDKVPRSAVAPTWGPHPDPPTIPG